MNECYPNTVKNTISNTTKISKSKSPLSVSSASTPEDGYPQQMMSSPSGQSAETPEFNDLKREKHPNMFNDPVC